MMPLFPGSVTRMSGVFFWESYYIVSISIYGTLFHILARYFGFVNRIKG